MNEGTGLAPMGPGRVVSVVGSSPMPAFNGKQMAEALHAYKDLQVALDAAMPDQIMQLEGKAFRKKGYWRAVAVAFGISVETVEERREVAGGFQDGRPNFGYVVTRRASLPNGRSVVADGTCFAVEKARRFKCPHPESQGSRRTLHFPHSSCPDFDPEFQWRTLPGDATEHNVRGHASTRAFNRAVSDLVGFGEVSAEEADVDAQGDHGHQAAQAQAAGQGRTSAAAAATGPATGAPGAPAGQPSAAAAPGVTTVKAVSRKAGTNAKGPYTNYRVTFADGRVAGTFSDSLGEEMAAAMKSVAPVNPDLEQSGKYLNLVGLKPLVAAAAPPVEAPAPPDEPVDGPEKVLSVRKVTTEQGDRWIIQTGKRVLHTEIEQHAIDANAARKAGTGLIPEFEVVPVRDGAAHVNRLRRYVPPSVPPAAAREPGSDDE